MEPFYRFLALSSFYFYDFGFSQRRKKSNNLQSYFSITIATTTTTPTATATATDLPPLLDNSEVEDMLQKMKSKDTDVYHRVMEIPVSPTEEDDGSLSCIGEDFFLRIEDKITNNSRKSDDELWNGYYKDLAVSVDVYHL